MGKICIATLEDARPVGPPPGFDGDAETAALLDQAKDPLHAHLHRLGRGAGLRIGPLDVDCMGYVWDGSVDAGGRPLAATSSFVVERGAVLDIRGSGTGATVVTFKAAQPPAQPRAGGHVHLLPAERVPRAELTGTRGAAGGLHADASCPTCHVWLHENSLAPVEEEPADAASEKGVHSHSEDEVIFVTDGHMRLGQRLYGRGSAIAIPAQTLYSFGVGPEGLKFVNFRARRPSEIRFKAGGTMDEVAFWRDRVGTPEYLAPAP
jgi:hypothetical protein